MKSLFLFFDWPLTFRVLSLVSDPVHSRRGGGLVQDPLESCLFWTCDVVPQWFWTGTSWNAAVRAFLQSAVVKNELDQKIKLSVRWSINVPTLTSGLEFHFLFILSQRTRSKIHKVPSAGQSGSARWADPPHQQEGVQESAWNTNGHKKLSEEDPGLGMPWDTPGRASD